MWATDEHTCRKLLAHTKLDLVAFRVLRAFWHKEYRHLLQYLQSNCSEMETQEKQCCWKGIFKPGVLLSRKKPCRFYRLIDGKKKNASVSALQLHRWVFVSITVSDMNFSRLRLSAVPPEATMLPKKPTLLRKLSAIFTVCQLIIIWLIALVYNITWTDASGLFCINCANFPYQSDLYAFSLLVHAEIALHESQFSIGKHLVWTSGGRVFCTLSELCNYHIREINSLWHFSQ